jgi:hypothetical protein
MVLFIKMTSFWFWFRYTHHRSRTAAHAGHLSAGNQAVFDLKGKSEDYG